LDLRRPFKGDENEKDGWEEKIIHDEGSDDTEENIGADDCLEVIGKLICSLILGVQQSIGDEGYHSMILYPI
jgi:hypothetical protein